MFRCLSKVECQQFFEHLLVHTVRTFIVLTDTSLLMTLGSYVTDKYAVPSDETDLTVLDQCWPSPHDPFSGMQPVFQLDLHTE